MGMVQLFKKKKTQLAMFLLSLFCVALLFFLWQSSRPKHLFHISSSETTIVKLAAGTACAQEPATFLEPETVQKIVKLFNNFTYTKREYYPEHDGNSSTVYICFYSEPVLICSVTPNAVILDRSPYVEPEQQDYIYTGEEDYFLPLFQLMGIDPEEYYQQE